jgi:hypothetical protein
MRVALARVAGCVLVVLLGLAAASAQFGHPLKGSWSGDWGTSPQARNRVLLDLQWDGKAITGTINPGPDAVPIQRATVNVSDWTLRLEAPGYVIEGKLENLGAYARFITGTWTQNGVKGDFKVTRN